MEKHATSTLSWTIASVGMTMIAFSFLCPALLVPGIALSAISGLLKLHEIHGSVSNWIDQKKNKAKHMQAAKSSTVNAVKNSHDFQDSSVAHLGSQDRLNTIMAYHLTCDEMDKSAKRPTLANFVKQLGQSLQGKSI